jgi:hypothetical protein
MIEFARWRAFYQIESTANYDQQLALSKARR